MIAIFIGISLSQDPDILQLQQRLFEQLCDNEKISDKYTTSIESQLQELIKAAGGNKVLLCLDGERAV